MEEGNCVLCGEPSSDGDPVLAYAGLFEPGVVRGAHVDCARDEGWEGR